MPDDKETAPRGAYYGWWIVAAAAVGMSTGPGQFAFGALGLFMLPLSSEFAWSRTQISVSLTCFTVALAIAIPQIGRWVDRYGSRKVLLPSILAFGVLLALIPLLANRLWILWLLFVLIGSVGAGANSLPYLRTLSAWFDRRRGLAMGLAMGGSGVGYVYVPPAVRYMIENHGWRAGYFLLAAVTLLIALPVVHFALREAPSARDKKALAELYESVAPEQAVPQTPLRVLLGQALLWQLFGIFCLLSFSLYGVLSHLVPMLSDRGMSAASAALVQSTLGMAIVASRVVIGVAMDRFFAPFVAVACFSLSAVGVGLLGAGAVGATAFLAAVLVGISIGAEIDLLAYLTGRYFGVPRFGKVYGVLFTSFLLGTSLGPVAYGMAYESMGSYSGALFVTLGLMVVAALATARLPRYSRAAG